MNQALAGRPLPFTGRLIQGDPDELPPLIAQSLSSDGPITFTYREQISHDDYHIPLAVTALDPVTYFGAPLGDMAVDAFATLTIQRGDTVIGDYKAKAYVSKSYTLYSKPSHREIEQAARAAVREKIDAKLASDSDRLARLARTQSNPAAPQLPE
jgi:hypothetical protein